MVAIIPGMETAAPLRTESSRGLSGSPKTLPGLLLPSRSALPDPRHQLVSGPVEPVDHRPAAEDLGGDDKARRHRLAVRGQRGQVEALVAQQDQVVGERVVAGAGN